MQITILFFIFFGISWSEYNKNQRIFFCFESNPKYLSKYIQEFEKSLQIENSSEENSSSGSAEESILKEIRKK